MAKIYKFPKPENLDRYCGTMIMRDRKALEDYRRMASKGNYFTAGLMVGMLIGMAACIFAEYMTETGIWTVIK